MKPHLYLAAPLFNPSERAFNFEIERYLERDAEVFLPQRDGNLLADLLAAGMAVSDARASVYQADTRAIQTCDILVAVLDGRTVDEGVAFELGYGRALGKICIAFKTDQRSLLPSGDNPMITCACHHRCSTVDELLRLVRSLADKSQQVLLAARG